MADTTGRDTKPGAWDPDDPGFAELLAEALAAEQDARPIEAPDVLEGETNGAPAGPDDAGLERTFLELGEPCLEGEGAQAWSERLLEDDPLRAHLADLAAARLDADDTELPIGVRDAALRAFERSMAPLDLVEAPGSARPLSVRRGVREEPLRVRRPAPVLRRLGGWVAAAALLLAALGAAFYLSDQDQVAEAGLQLTSLKRVDLGGSVRMSTVEPRYFAKLGRLFTPAADELLAFGFTPEARLVVGSGDAVRVTRSPLATRVAEDLADVEAVGAILRLESGEARLATTRGPILLEIDDLGILVLVEGVAHVAFDPGSGTGASQAPAVALATGGIARFYRAEGDPIPLTGPGRVRLAASGPQAFGEPARSLFRDLQFFGGVLPTPPPVRRVSPRLWRVESGTAHRRRGCLHLPGAAAGGDARVRLAWRPLALVADAVSVRVALRAPEGTRVVLPQLGADGLAVQTALEAPQAESAEPGVTTVELPLPADWYRRLRGESLKVDIIVPEAAAAAPGSGTPASSSSGARFDGVSLVLGASSKEALRMAGSVDRE